MAEHIQHYGTDGVRGKAGVFPLDERGAFAIGAALGTYASLNLEDVQSAVIGWDTRESSRGISARVAEGIASTGMDVTYLGVIPTPGVSVTVRESDKLLIGSVTTASHNPFYDNGSKAIGPNGGKLPDNAEETLSHYINDPHGTIKVKTPGRITSDSELVERYDDFVVNHGTNLKDVRIGIDPANGAASFIAPRVFTRLGAEVHPINNHPDGRNINDNCSAMHPEVLSEHVLKNNLDFGATFDGDADRGLLIDNKGNILHGDYMLYVNAVVEGLSAVVGTEMTNIGLVQALAAEGIDLYRAKVGDRYVSDMLIEKGLLMGGEQSGHIISRDVLPTGDGMLTVLRTIKNIRESGISAPEWYKKLVLFPQKILTVPVVNRTVAFQDENLAEMAAHITAELGEDGRVSVRPSGTEQSIRLMVEARDNKTVDEKLLILSSLLSQYRDAAKQPELKVLA